MRRLFSITLAITMVLVLSSVQAVELHAQGEVTFTGTELLGRPTDDSVTVNVVADTALDYYFEYGTTSGTLDQRIPATDYYTSVADEPIEVVIDGLTANTRYYYRMVYRETGTTDWIERDESSFHTQRPAGSTFTFTIIADSHIGFMGDEDKYIQTLSNVSADEPDFHIDLGDTFDMDGVDNETQARQVYLHQRDLMGSISHSAPIFLALGNHENEEGWNFDDTPVSKALLSIDARKLYYPNPITDGFYSGNDDPLTTPIGGDLLREDYYAWEWGDALFVVLDPFHYTMIKPYSGASGGEDDDEGPGSNDAWDWTLGYDQYLWFKQTLENSDATFKFVFSHHVTGGMKSYTYVRGGAEAVPYFEWGGQNWNDSWEFNTERPGWESPVHQLMVTNGVSAFFHGHDHEYAYEEIDGIVYQLVPAPGMTGYGFNLYHESDPYTIEVLPNPGHLRVTVSPDEATVEYIATSDGLVNHSYTIEADTENSPPVADDQAVSTMENTPVDITLTGSDVDGDTLTFEVVDGPANGVLSGSGATQTYTPNAGYIGADNFTFRVNDGQEDSNIATVTIEATEFNNPPMADDQGVSTDEDTPVAITLTGSDEDGDALTYEVVDGPTNGVLSGSGATRTYTPNADYNGPDSFTFRANDGQADSEPATVSITVDPVNDAPVADDQAASTSEDTPVEITLSGSDVDGDALTFQVVDGPTNGVLSGSGATRTYTPNAGYTGTDSFTFRANDGQEDSNVATVSISVAGGSYALSFDGSDDIVRADEVPGTGPLTIEAWVRPDENNADGLMVVGTDDSAGWSLELNGGQLTLWLSTNQGWQSAQHSTALQAGQWYHVAATYENGTVRLFVDGVASTATSVGTLTQGPTLSIGGFGSYPFFDGTIDEVRISNVVRYTSDFVPSNEPFSSDANTLGLWHFDEGAGQIAADASTLANDGTLGDTDNADSADPTWVEGYVTSGPPDNNAPDAVDDSAGTDEDTAVTIDVLANDSDVDGDTLTVSQVIQPANGSVANNGTDVTYTPAADYCGSDSFGYTVSDGNGGSDTATVDVSVTCVNDAPVADDQDVTTRENTPVDITLTASDVDGDALTYEVVDGPTNGVLSGSGATRTYTPDADYIGPDSFTFRANDGTADSNIATVAIEVTEFNTPPVADDQAVSTDEDTSVEITLTGSDEDGDALTYEVVDGPTNGVLSGSGATQTYTPNADYNGPDSFTFRAKDGAANSNIATVSITVDPVNDAPMADDQAVSTSEDTSVEITLTASDVDGDALTYEVVDGPTNGVLSGSGATRTYTPNAGYTGPDSLTFRANDGQEDSNIATVNLSVMSEPAGVLEFGVVTVGGNYVTVNLDKTYVSPVVVCSVQYNNSTTPVVARVSNVTATSFDVRLQNPSGGAVAAERVSYVVVEEGTWTIDGVNVEAQTYLSTVTDENNNWVGEPQSYGQSYTNPVVLGQVMSENDPDWSVFWCQGSSRTDPPSATALTTGKMVGEDTDTTRADETIGFIVFEAGHGTIGGVEYEAFVGADSVQGVDHSPPYAYTFNTAFAAAPQVVLTTLAGMDGANGGWAQTHGLTLATTTSLYLSIDEDQVGDSERNHVNEQVAYVAFGPSDNTPPVADDDSATTNEDTPISIDVLANDSDVDGDTLTVSAVTQPTNGSVVNNGTDVTYTPDTDYCGSDSFGHTVGDGNGGSDTATVDVSVTCVNDVPVADDQDVSTEEDVAVDITLSASDVDGDALTFEVVDGPTNGVLSGSGATRTYTPNAGYIGPDSFTFRANDGTADSNIATVTIDITEVNNPPVADDQAVTTDEDTPVDITLTASDVDGDPLTYSVVDGPTYGVLTGEGANLIYTPNTDYNGPDSFTFRANDGQANSNTATVSITVDPINDPPVADDQEVNTSENTPVDITLTASDVDGDPLTYSVVDGPTNGVLTGEGTNLTYTPNAGYIGTDSFTFQANDGTADSNIATVSISVIYSNYALSFDGSDDIVRADQVPGTGPLSIEAWVRPNDDNADGLLIVGTDDNDGWSLELNDGQLTLWLATSQGWQYTRHSTLWQAGQWYHVAATYENGSAWAFVNGTSSAATSVGTLTQGPSLLIGGFTDYPFFDGTIDEVRISNIVRYTSDFVLPTAPFSPDTNTLALWHFDEGAGQIASDASTFANHGTLGDDGNVDTADPSWVDGYPW